MSAKDSMLDEIVLMGDPVLKSETAPIETIDDEIKELANHMLDVMYAAEGCGLAAPQIGKSVSMVVIDCDWGDGTAKNPYVLINPQIIDADGEPMMGSEGCLSFPGISVDVGRPSHVVVHAQNLDGDTMRYEAEGSLMARCLQHEIDHLHGVTMLDHLGPMARMKAKGQVEAAIKEGVRPGETD